MSDPLEAIRPAEETVSMLQYASHRLLLTLTLMGVWLLTDLDRIPLIFLGIDAVCLVVTIVTEARLRAHHRRRAHQAVEFEEGNR